jgi:hypothetical protein
VPTRHIYTQRSKRRQRAARNALHTIGRWITLLVVVAALLVAAGAVVSLVLTIVI